jgi:hypothetical protein
VLAIVVLLAIAPGASAATSTYQHIGEFGGAGTGVGFFKASPTPQRIALYDHAGLLFVADRGSNRVEAFAQTSSGAEYAFEIPVQKPAGLAVSQIDGSLYVSNEPAPGLEEGIQKFVPDDLDHPTAYTVDSTFHAPVKGSGTGQFGKLITADAEHPMAGGLAVAPNGDLVVADVGRKLIQRYTAGGDFVSSFTGCGEVELYPGFCFNIERPVFSDIRDVAVDGSGDVIVADEANPSNPTARVDLYHADGTFVGTLSKENNPVPNTQLISFYNSGIALAASPTSDEVFVSSVTGSVIFGETSRVFQFDGDQFVKSFTVGASAELHFHGYVAGMAAGSASHRFYALGSENPPAYFPGSPYRVQAFEAIEPPTLALNAATTVTATTAHLAGSVDAHGRAATWHFQYRPVGASTWMSSPVPDGAIDANAGQVGVENAIETLEPNTEYEFKLSASVGSVSQETVPLTFKTLIAPPAVDTAQAAFVTEAGARLVAGVNPRNTSTTFYFEWGETASYGSVAPAVPGPAGNGGARVVVNADISALRPATTYHFRVVAENDVGDLERGDDVSFTTLAASQGGLQGERGFELATRQPADLSLEQSGARVSVDGNSLVYDYGEINVPLPEESEQHKVVLGTRGTDGWRFRTLDQNDPGHMFWIQRVITDENMKTVFMEPPQGIDPEDQNGVADLYLERPEQDPLWITRSELVPPGEPQTDFAAAPFGVMPISDDGSAVAFLSNRRLLASDLNPSGPNGTPIGQASTRLYKWRAGKLTLISELADGAQPTGTAISAGGSVPGSTVTVNPAHAMSPDGRRLLWSDGTTLYQYVDGRGSKALTHGKYVDASPDGTRIYYIENGHIYSLNVDSGTTHDLTGAAEVQGAVAVAETGERIYYVAKAALDAEASPLGERPMTGANNLYVTRMDAAGAPVGTRLVARLSDSAGDEGIWGFDPDSRPAAGAPNGAVLAFASSMPLTGQATSGVRQLFVYDDRAGALVCPSCMSGAQSPSATAGVNGRINAGGLEITPEGWGGKRIVAEDGTVFFDTPTALLPEDRNVSRDVYEYRNGQLRMLTAGKDGEGPSALVGASRDGTTVFVAAPTPFTSEDTEAGFYKFWAVRVGGGFASRTPAPECEGVGCEGVVQPPPAVSGTASRTFFGAGNVSERGVRAALRVKALAPDRRGGIRLRVTVASAGRITVTGPKVRRLTKVLPRGGAYRLRIPTKGTRSAAPATTRATVTFKADSGRVTKRKVRLRLPMVQERRARIHSAGGRR